ncbi:MAG: DNA primase [Bacteroides sp. CAG:1060_57_27]|nr:MAG: DNA primase [Bacteroides sp. CAG:1060_57_27]
MIPRETVSLILDTARIEEVVSDYVTLKRRGANFVACCPFHNEKTPSFYVSPSKGIFKCFGCGKSGSAVGFVMEEEHCSYADALRYLARKYNIEIHEKEETAEDIARRQRSESLLLVSEFAQKFFVSQLSTREGAACGGEYFKSRGIEPATIAKFGLGWAPAAKSSLVDAALAAGYKAEYLLDAGVAVQREDGSLADKFRERVMFPVHSVSGRVIAFSGRTLRSDNPAKYVNSPETEIYVKSRNLLGIYFAKSEISRLDKCILVEGNIDMVMMHQLGIRNVVASCGTSLTVEQIRLIHKFTDNISIMYDGDSAGVHAAIRGLSMILSEGMNVKVVLLPENEDPDSFSRKHTLQEVQAYIEGGEKDFITFKTDLLLEQAEGDPLKKAELINDIADTIAVIPDPIKRSTYVDETARRFGVESAILFQRISGVRRSGAAGMQAQSRTEPEEPAPVQEWTEENRLLAPSEKDLLSFLLTHGCDELDFPSDSEYYGGDEDFKPSVADFIRDALEADGTKMANSAYAAVYDAYMALYDEGLAQDDIVKRLLDSPDRTVASVAAQLSTHKYMITVKAFENALTTVPSWLAAQVPRAIMCYADCRISDRLEQLRRTLSEELSPEVQTASMQEMVKLQAARKRIRKMIGREKNTV